MNGGARVSPGEVARFDLEQTVRLDVTAYRQRLGEAFREDALALMDRHPRILTTFATALKVVFRRAGFGGVR